LGKLQKLLPPKKEPFFVIVVNSGRERVCLQAASRLRETRSRV
jgi:hypothetical protein